MRETPSKQSDNSECFVDDSVFVSIKAKKVHIDNTLIDQMKGMGTYVIIVNDFIHTHTKWCVTLLNRHDIA